MVIKQRNISFDSEDFFSLFMHPNFPLLHFPKPPDSPLLVIQALADNVRLYRCSHTVKGHLKVKQESFW